MVKKSKVNKTSIWPHATQVSNVGKMSLGHTKQYRNFLLHVLFFKWANPEETSRKCVLQEQVEVDVIYEDGVVWISSDRTWDRVCVTQV